VGLRAGLDGRKIPSPLGFDPGPHFTSGKDQVPILQEAGWAPGPVWTGGKFRPHWDSIPDRTLPPGKTRYTFYRRLGGPQGRSGRAENLVPTGIRSRTALYLRERPGTHFTGGWVGPRAGLDGRKISSPLGFDPGPSSP